MQNRATLRNALRKRNDELPSVSNDMQSSETLRNSLGLNYKSAALPTELCWRFLYESCFQWVDQEFVMTLSRTTLQKGPKFHVIFLRHEKWFKTPRRPGSS